MRYVGVEQGEILSTIDLYPKGKYIFFKPDTRDWFGGIPAVGLGLATAKYGDSTSADDDQPIFDALGQELENIIRDQAPEVAQLAGSQRGQERVEIAGAGAFTYLNQHPGSRLGAGFLQGR